MMSAKNDGYFNLIVSSGRTGSFNMSADLSLLNNYKTMSDFSSRPTLRIYYFDPPALSLGFFQKDKNLDEGIIAKAKNKGYDIVSRPTGGRAVLHKDEITYCIAASYKEGIFAGKLLETYKKVGEFIYMFFINLGLSPDDDVSLKANEKGNVASERGNSFNCFLKTHSYEITFDGKKICGNSQRRNESTFLQHGSIYVDYNPAEHLELFEGGSFNSDYFDNITGIKQEMRKTGIHFDSHTLSFKRLSDIMIKSFRDTYNLESKHAVMPI